MLNPTIFGMGSEFGQKVTNQAQSVCVFFSPSFGAPRFDSFCSTTCVVAFFWLDRRQCGMYRFTKFVYYYYGLWHFMLMNFLLPPVLRITLKSTLGHSWLSVLRSTANRQLTARAALLYFFIFVGHIFFKFWFFCIVISSMASH